MSVVSSSQVSLACLLLKVTFSLRRAESINCPLCPEGYYMRMNCTVLPDGRIRGAQCLKCSDCSEGQVIQTSCSWFSDSVCVGGAKNNTMTTTVTPTGQQESQHKEWFILTAIVLSVAVVLLLCLCVLLLTCRPHTYKGLDQP